MYQHGYKVRARLATFPKVKSAFKINVRSVIYPSGKQFDISHALCTLHWNSDKIWLDLELFLLVCANVSACKQTHVRDTNVIFLVLFLLPSNLPLCIYSTEWTNYQSGTSNAISSNKKIVSRGNFFGLEGIPSYPVRQMVMELAPLINTFVPSYIDLLTGEKSNLFPQHTVWNWD